MRLREVKRAVFEKHLFERGEIEGELEDTAMKLRQASAFGGGDETAMNQQPGAEDPAAFGQTPDPMAVGGQSPLQTGNEPELPPMAGPGEDIEDEELMKKVDSQVIAAVKGHDYASKWDHPERSGIHPFKILGLSMDELHELRTSGRAKAQAETLGGELGSYDNDELKFWQDLISYTDKVIAAKKNGTEKHKRAKEGKTATFDTQEPSKNNKAKEYKVKKK